MDLSNGAHLVVVGAGGNIGSHLVPLLGRMTGVGQLTLIDPDVYEDSNLQSQDITLDDLGRPKAEVQARRLKSFAPDLPVNVLVAAVEDVPWGQLRGDVILTGLDTRRARQAVNRRARWLGIPWLDAGVEAGSGLARVSCFGPGAEQPCLECAWTDADYELLEQRYSCDGSPLAQPASSAPARLGALAAAWQAIECHRLLASRNDAPHWGRQWVITTEGAEVFQSVLTAHAGCRLFGHAPWRIELVPARADEMSLGEAYGLAGVDQATRQTLGLEVPDLDFITRLQCQVCGRHRDALLLATDRQQRFAHCDACGRDVPMKELNPQDDLLLADLDAAWLDRPLAGLGFRPGEIFRLSGENVDRCFQLPLAGLEVAAHEA